LARALAKNRIDSLIAVIGGSPEPISQDAMATVVGILNAGGSVLLVSDRHDLRDYAKRKITAMGMPCNAGAVR
jgi:hypothetical protein